MGFPERPIVRLGDSPPGSNRQAPFSLAHRCRPGEYCLHISTARTAELLGVVKITIQASCTGRQLIIHVICQALLYPCCGYLWTCVRLRADWASAGVGGVCTKCGLMGVFRGGSQKAFTHCEGG